MQLPAKQEQILSIALCRLPPMHQQDWYQVQNPDVTFTAMSQQSLITAPESSKCMDLVNFLCKESFSSHP